MIEKTFADARTEDQKIVDEYVKARVLKGLDLLQRKHGDDWVNHINLKDLNLASSTKCVLGQLYAEHPLVAEWGDGYDAGVAALHLKRPENYGFVDPFDYGDVPAKVRTAYENIPDYVYHTLTNLWKCVIEKVRTGGNPKDC